MEKKIRVCLLAAAFLSFFAPENNNDSIAAFHYLVSGTTVVVFHVIPDILSIPHKFSLWMQSAGAERPYVLDVLTYVWWAISYLIKHLAFLFWVYAVPFLLLWNAFLLLVRLGKWKIVYRIWLLISVISSLYINLDPSYDIGSGMGVWMNPVLLILALAIEIWLWFRKDGIKRPQEIGI